jgi:hypothetical protein
MKEYDRGISHISNKLYMIYIYIYVYILVMVDTLLRRNSLNFTTLHPTTLVDPLLPLI